MKPATSLKPSEVATMLDYALKAQINVMLWGPPGCAKTSLVEQLATRHNLPKSDVNGIAMIPNDLLGWQYQDKQTGKVSFTPPDCLPTDPGPGIIFVDEINQANPTMQALMHNLFAPPYRIGSWVKPGGYISIGAGNRAEDRAMVQQMTTPLKGRVMHIDIDPDPADWVTWALANGVAMEVVGCIRFDPSILYNFDPRRDDRGSGTFRNWERLSDFFQTDPPDEIAFAGYAGNVGEANASKFMGFLELYQTDLPTREEITMSPDTAPIPRPELPSAQFAVASLLVNMASTMTVDSVMTYADRLPGDFSILVGRDIQVKKPDVARTNGWRAWAIKHQAELS